MKIGVLALQGAFIEHIKALRSLDVEVVEVRKLEQLRNLDGLIIPGGESTTFGKLAVEYGLIEPMRALCDAGKPVWGTCAGMIFLAKEVGRAQPLLGVMDVQVKRNAFGRQVDSFEIDLDIPALEPARPSTRFLFARRSLKAWAKASRCWEGWTMARLSPRGRAIWS